MNHCFGGRAASIFRDEVCDHGRNHLTPNNHDIYLPHENLELCISYIVNVLHRVRQKLLTVSEMK